MKHPQCGFGTFRHLLSGCQLNHTQLSGPVGSSKTGRLSRVQHLVPANPCFRSPQSQKSPTRLRPSRRLGVLVGGILFRVDVNLVVPSAAPTPIGPSVTNMPFEALVLLSNQCQTTLAQGWESNTRRNQTNLNQWEPNF